MPLRIGPMAGMLHPSGGAVGIVVVPGIGDRALRQARSFARFGAMAAAAGYPVLCYEHVGTGNSGDPDQMSLSEWTAGVVEVAAYFCHRIGVRHVVLMGEGPGALIALKAAPQVDHLAGVIVLAPDPSGRIAVSRLAASGEDLPGSLAADLRGVTLSDREPAPFYLVATRANNADDATVVARLEARGTTTLQVPLVGGPEPETISDQTFFNLLERLRLAAPSQKRLAASNPDLIADHSTPVYRETSLRFGPGQRLFGIYCEPTGVAPTGPAVILVRSGTMPMSGENRKTVLDARALAAAGVASLRFDASGVGQSRGDIGQDVIADIDQARAGLAGVGHGRIILAGDGPAGVIALHAAAALAGIDDVFAGDLPASTDIATAIAAPMLHSMGTQVASGTPPTIGPMIRKIARIVFGQVPHLPFGSAEQDRANWRQLVDRAGKAGVSVHLSGIAGTTGADRLRASFGRVRQANRARPHLSLIITEPVEPAQRARQLLDQLIALVNR